MSGPAPPGPTVTIDRLSCRYLVAGDHPDPPGVAARLDAVARGQLAGRCATTLPRAVDTGDPAVWVMRRLELGVTLPVGTDDLDLLAQRWASGIAAQIAAVVQGRVELPGVVRYPNRAAYLASFAADLPRGDARQRWEYAPFAGLATLPPGQALVAAAAKVGVSVVELVELLARTRRLDGVLAGLGRSAAPLWRECMAPAVAADPQAVAAVHDRRAALAGPAPSGAVARLRLFGAMLASAPPVAPAPALATAVDEVATRLEETPIQPARPRSAAAPEAAPRPASTRRSVQHPAAAPPGDGAPRLEPPSSPGVAPRPVPPRPEAQSLSSPWLSVVRLLPCLLATCDVLAGRERAGALARHRVLVRCAGDRLVGVAADPALRLVCGLDLDEPVPEQVSEEVAALVGRAAAIGAAAEPGAADLDFLGAGSGGEADIVVTRLAAASIRRFARTLLGFGRASAAHLAANVYLVPGTLTVQPGRLDALLEPAPLQVVLDLAGLSTMSCRLPWLDPGLSPLVVRTAGGAR